jgi:ABC-2 type transport system ATP-binding protein
MADKIAVQVEHVFKDFVITHEKANSIKSLFTGIARGGHGSTDTQHALRDISFEVKEGEFFGIVGRNGSGKSTLLKILAGIYQPTKGQVHTHGKLVPFIELGVGFNPELTGRENVFLNGAMLGFSRKEVDAMYDEIVAFAELEQYMDKKLKNYSSGMQVRLAFSMATRAEADILLVDEVLAVGDADFQKKCYKYFKDLKRDKKTVIFVSHDMNAVAEYCDRALLIEQSEVVVEGTSHDVAMAYTRMFLEQDKDTDSLKKGKQRWGDETVKYETVNIDPKELGADKSFKITTKAKVKKDAAEAVFGFKIRTDDDTQLLGTNNKLKDQRLKNLKKGETVTIEWEIPNVLNSGNYFIDVAIQSEDYSEVYDWWEGSARLLVDRSENNSYPFHPIITANISKET